MAERTYDETRELVNQAVTKAVATGEDVWTWVRDLTDEWAVYEVSGANAETPGLYKVTYSIDDAGTVSLGSAEKVETEYVPVAEGRDRHEGRVLEAKGTAPNGGRIFQVQILEYGESKNGRRYPESVMRRASRLYEGAKAYDHHRTDAELETSTIEGLIGSYRNVSPAREGLQAELHLLPSATHTAEALDASLAAQAAGLPPLVGISHDVMALFQVTAGSGGRQVQEATEIVSVFSADVVADPAAGGRATRMVAGGLGGPTSPEEGEQVNLKQLLELLRAATAEKRAELLTEHAAVLEDAGITAEQATALVEPAVTEPTTEPVASAATEPKEPVGAGAATEAVHGRESLLGRQLIRVAMADAKIDERLTESVTKGLPEKFTEGQLTAHIATLSALADEMGKAGLAPTVPAAGPVTKDALDRKVEALDKMLAGQSGGYRSLKHAYADITGNVEKFLDTEDFNRKMLRESIGSASFDSAVRSSESLTSASWAEILGDSITRRMVAEYAVPGLDLWREIVSSIATVNDFRTQRIDRLGGYGLLPTVAESGVYQPLPSPGDEEATYALTKRGGTEDLTLETITNDDLRQVQNIPRKLGRAAALTLYRFVMDIFVNNANTTYDATALFATGHGNTAAASALSQTTLSDARKAMRKQAAFGVAEEILSLVPKFLLVPSDLEELAFQLCTSAVAITSNADATIPNIHQGLQPRVVDYWTDTNDWFLVADPAQCPTIEVGFFQGRQDPELFVQNDPTQGSAFSADKVTYKIRHIYSAAVLDHRGLLRRQG